MKEVFIVQLRNEKGFDHVEIFGRPEEVNKWIDIHVINKADDKMRIGVFEVKCIK